MSDQEIDDKPAPIIYEHLLLKGHINTLRQKLNRANGILAKLRRYLSSLLIS